MKTYYKFLIFALMVIIPFKIYAENYTPKVYVLFINGVNNTEEISRNTLKKLKESSNINSNMIIWDALYNKTHGIAQADLWDVFFQKSMQKRYKTFDDFVQEYMKSKGLHYATDSEEYRKIRLEINEYMKKSEYYVGVNFESILDQFHKVVTDKENSYVLLISHSQGNLYANLLYSQLTGIERFPKDHIALFGIASPANNIKGEVGPINEGSGIAGDIDRYFTNYNDRVIYALRLLADSHMDEPMPANVKVGKCGDIFCHGMIETYLSDSDIQPLIIRKISHFLLSLKRRMVSEGNTRTLNKNVRLLFKVLHIKDNVTGKVELITNKKSICTVSGSNYSITADGNFINYLEVPIEHRKRLDGLDIDIAGDSCIGFADKLKPGEYTTLHDLPGEKDIINARFVGKFTKFLPLRYEGKNIMLLTEAYCSTPEQCSEAFAHPSFTDLNGGAYVAINHAFHLYKEKVPGQVFLNGKLISSRFVLK